MADKALLLIPGVAARVATWAAQDGRDDAVARGDAAASALASADLWGWGGGWSLAKMDYDTSLPSTRLEFWRSGEGLKNAPPLDSALQLQAEQLYAELYPGLLTTWPVMRGAAVAAASKGNAALALLRGAAAAKAAVDDGAWSLVNYATYLAKTDTAKVAFWASGGADLGTPTPAPTPSPTPPPPTPAPTRGGWGLFIAVVGLGVAGVALVRWLQ